MKPSTTLVLEDFAFSGLEIPSRINFGGKQSLAVHRLVGGQRVIDAMGDDPSAISWAGLHVGTEALARSRYLDFLRKQGKQLTLSWSEFIYTVIVSSYQARMIEKQGDSWHRIEYTIACEVVQQIDQPVTQAPQPDADYAIGQDMNDASSLAGQIGDGTLSSLIGTLDTAIKAVSSFATATTDTLNSVLGPLAAVQSRVQVLIGSAANAAANAATLGGVVPHNPLAAQAAALSSQAASMQQYPLLVNLQSTVARMQANVAAVGSASSSVVTVVQAGGNLFQLASSKLGDATRWSDIAKLNGISDPMLTGINTIKVPKS